MMFCYVVYRKFGEYIFKKAHSKNFHFEVQESHLLKLIYYSPHTCTHTLKLLLSVQFLTHIGVQQVDTVQALAAVDSALDSTQRWFALH